MEPKKNVQSIRGYFMPYYVTPQYLNCQLDIEIEDADTWTVYDMRKKLEKVYHYPHDCFIIGHVLDDKMTQFFEASWSIKEILKVKNHGVILFYGIPQKLQPCIKQESLSAAFDQNHNIVSNEWVKMVMLISKNFESLDKCGHERFNLPRILWFKKRWSLAKVHRVIYRHFRQLFVVWMREPFAKDGKTAKCKAEANYFLPVPSGWDFEKSGLTRGEEKLTHDHLKNRLLDSKEEYATFFPNMGTDCLDWDDMLDEAEEGADQKERQAKARSPYPYDLLVYDRYLKRPKRCPMCCTWNNNHTCLLQYDEGISVQDLLDRMPPPPSVRKKEQWAGDRNNMSFYIPPTPTSGTGSGDVVLNMVWHQDFQREFIKGLSYMETADKTGAHKHDLAPERYKSKKRDSAEKTESREENDESTSSVDSSQED